MVALRAPHPTAPERADLPDDAPSSAPEEDEPAPEGDLDVAADAEFEPDIFEDLPPDDVAEPVLEPDPDLEAEHIAFADEPDGSAPPLPPLDPEALAAVKNPFQVELVSETIPEPRRYHVVFDDQRLDPDVQKVIRRLTRHRHEAYLVGGCVRDLLLDRRPKDFDVATSARPEEVRDLFRNSRIIGRRFRLVHVLFGGGKVIEVATFRRNPKEDGDEASELLIRNDNVFGAAHEDALRRDFRINALFYDLEARQVLDWVGGMEDLRRQVVHTIGGPETRFREDPIRILRALKFAGRLGFGITPDVYDAIVFCRDVLALAARPRLSEEILRLMRGGQARRTIYLAWETGVLDILLPEVSALIYDDRGDDGPGQRMWRLLDFADRRTAEGRPLDDTVLWTLLLLEPMKEACDGARDRAGAVADFLEPLIERLAISRRYADGMRRIVAVLPRLTSGRAGRFARTEIFQASVEVAAADLAARGLSTEPVDRFLAPPPSRRPRYEGHFGR
ncbi:polynucleotide adenylyltransferase PcnB [Chondromyces apiculatus]|uniref:Poly(A) polymerase n=1 Tax=Chondromyces apiculatus DSM 436 TaxID=1192034 RepID=A0A017SYP3_9BACT|nr:polynucleotide adenylyltransferase PcnB [Chondromyces apiculatus]EYF01745.1 Poly(A) polymerase [Chondromyces apiculatus DSM 436]